MKDLIRKILKESEDEFDWVNDISEDPLLPRPDGNHYVLRFKQGTQPDVFRKLAIDLKQQGWGHKDPELDEYLFGSMIKHSMVTYSAQSDEAYISLKPNGRISVGSSIGTFNSVNTFKMNDVLNIWYS